MIVQSVQMLQMLQRRQYDISYHEDMGKNNRQKTVETILGEEQLGFMPGRGTTDVIFALKKAQEKKLEVEEMIMLRCMCRVTKLDNIRNERIRGTTKVGKITKKVQERRLKWCGHVMRREEHYVGGRAMVMKVQGRRKRGRPKKGGWTK